MSQSGTDIIRRKTDLKGVRRIMGFHVDDKSFGVDIKAVNEIIRSAPLTTVPNAPDYIEGLMMLRGKIFPLINFRKKIYPEQEEKKTGNSWIIVLQNQDTFAGVRVDSVIGVLTIPPNCIHTEEEHESLAINSRFIAGSCILDNTLILLPDFNSILFESET